MPQLLVKDCSWVEPGGHARESFALIACVLGRDAFQEVGMPFKEGTGF